MTSPATALLALHLAAVAAPTNGVGASLYLHGVLGSGERLTGTREADDAAVTGPDAACVNCHQRSGLGSVEGRVSIPPNTGEYLFRPRTREAGAPGLPYVETSRGNREPYTEATLARAIRDGLDPQGRPLGYLMPRFALGDEDMAVLVAYLKQLGATRVPGVSDTVLHFATVVTPDADPKKRQGTIEVLEQFFAQKNRAPLKPSPPMQTSGRTLYAKSMYLANRHWQLHVWELSGPASTWRDQLEKRLAAEPVYAVLSGVGGSNWAPVHAFCEDHAMPCLFPNVEVPVDAEGDFWSVYFSRGVLLEARLVARAVLGGDGHPVRKDVEVVYRAGDSGEAAASALAKELKGHGIAVHATVLGRRASDAEVVAALRTLGRRESARSGAVILWLRPADLGLLARVPPVGGSVYVSGLMGGLERTPLPASWRGSARMTYPFDLPERRGVRLDYPLGWFSARRIPVVEEQVQTDTYLACNLVADVMNRMADNVARPYLLEQLQDQLDHRIITGYYPRLALASNQRFASKGGYLVHFRDPAGTALVADGDWTVP
jgi:cytochrome c553